jgi:hypothetical protein
MLLHHSTDEQGKVGIEQEGFRGSRQPHSAGHVWMSGSRQWPSTSRREWWVLAELPDEVAKRFRHCFEDGTPSRTVLRTSITTSCPWT